MTDLASILAAADPAVSRLRLARMVRGLTQRELERGAGLPATTVCYFETGRRRPDPAQRVRLAMALDVDVDALFERGSA